MTPTPADTVARLRKVKSPQKSQNTSEDHQVLLDVGGQGQLAGIDPEVVYKIQR